MRKSGNNRTAAMRGRTQDAVRLFCALAAAAALVAFAHFSGTRLCPLRRIFSIPCPTCGSTRAVIELAGGNISGAFAVQPLVTSVIIAGIPVAAVAAAAMGRERILWAARRLCGMPAVWIAVSLAVAANWLYVIARGN